MMTEQSLKAQLKEVLVREMNLEDVKPEEIADDAALFGDQGLGLDSLDAVELVVVLQKQFDVVIKDMDEGREAFRTIDSLAAFIEAKRQG
jgi:acyl carrier protein